MFLHLTNTSWLAAVAWLLVLTQPCAWVDAAESQWVQRGATGRLIYVPDAQGDQIPDFSDVGYQAGRMAIPDVATAATVQPGPGDDTAAIQAAINQVSQLPLGADGFRGAVLLGAGEYQIGSQLTINASGVVLRGSGRDPGGTVLRATGTTRRDLIEIEGNGSQDLMGSTRQMIDKTVPVGARSFRVDTTSGFSVGDTVRVTRPSTANWISDLGMDMLPPRSDGGTVTQWQAGSFDLRYDRVITRIEGDRIFIDAPLTNSFELQYGGGQIKRYEWDDRIENIGVENLRAESDFAFDTDENHAVNFVSIDKAQNVWVRDTTSAHFVRSSVLSNPGAKWVTVDNAINVEPKSPISGGRRYSFDLSGQLDLVTNSEANEGRHDFVNNSTRPAGPHVFHNSVANNALDESGPHQRWATGSLFDKITVDGDQINARNRGNFGTGHGWAGANMVIWNSEADSYIVQNPPTAQNWLVGSTGQVIDDQTFGPQPAGYIDSHGAPVEIDSLYESQLADRANVNQFNWSGGGADWDDPEAWNEKLTPGDYAIEMRDYLIGDIDDFTFDGASSVDNAFVDPAWQAFIQGSSGHPLTGFDDASGNRNVAFTITHQLDPGERVVHGSLAVALQASGGLVDSDFIRLFDGDADHRLLFSDMGWDTGLAGGQPFVGVVDLGVFTDELQSGAVNVQVNDDTSVDWAIYTIAVAKPTSSPSDATVFITGGGQAIVDSVITGVAELTVGGSSAGSLAIAPSGALAITDGYQQLSNGALQIEIGGDQSGEFGAISLTGDAQLDGELLVVLQPGFAPMLDDAFEIISATGQVDGVFSSITAAPLTAGLAWRTDYADSGVTLEVVLAGDYNGDGTVDAQDYALWRQTLGSTTNLAADGDNNRLIDSNDYTIWKANFGNNASSFATSLAGSSTPEPTTLPLLGMGLLGCFLRRTRKFTFQKEL